MDGLPLYVQVRNSIRESLENGSVKADASGVLPSQEQFASHFDVSVGTIRRAIKDLEDVGLVMSRRGKGLMLSDAVTTPAFQSDAKQSAVTLPRVGVAYFDTAGRTSSPYFQHVMRGVDALCDLKQVALNTMSLPGLEMEVQEEAFLANFSLMNIDGILLLTAVSSGFVARLRQKGIPYVCVNVLADRGDICHTCDFIVESYKVADAVFRRGCRNVLFFAGNEIRLSTTLRVSGYKLALAKSGIDINEKYIAYEDYELGHSDEIVGHMLDRGEKLDAVIAFDDMRAAGIRDYLVSRGREDILVAGFGNYAGYEDKVAITSDARLYELGYNSFKTLLEMINGVQPAKTKFIYDPILIERDILAKRR